MAGENSEVAPDFIYPTCEQAGTNARGESLRRTPPPTKTDDLKRK